MIKPLSHGRQVSYDSSATAIYDTTFELKNSEQFTRNRTLKNCRSPAISKEIRGSWSYDFLCDILVVQLQHCTQSNGAVHASAVDRLTNQA